MGLLDGRVAIVTGASRGIGAAIASRFATEGARVAIVARRLEPGGTLAGSLAETAAAIRSTGGECLTIQANLADPAIVLGSSRQRLRISEGHPC